jgi:hypothetical protein
MAINIPRHIKAKPAQVAGEAEGLSAWAVGSGMDFEGKLDRRGCCNRN